MYVYCIVYHKHGGCHNLVFFLYFRSRNIQYAFWAAHLLMLIVTVYTLTKQQKIIFVYKTVFQ